MLKSYVFDLDQNIVHTKTPIYLLLKQPDNSRKEQAIPNAEYEQRLSDKDNVKLHDDVEYSFRAFRGPGKLITDVFDAISNKAFGPSREKFKTATIEASPTHIVTARGNPVEDFKNMHKQIIYDILTPAEKEEFSYNMANHIRKFSKHFDFLVEQYLTHNLYIPCADPEIIRMYRWENKSPYEKKAAAFEQCIKQTINTYTSYYGKTFIKHRNISIGFSDDTKKNIDAVTQAILETLVHKYPNIIFHLYNTQNPKFIKKETIQKNCSSKLLF